MSQIGRDLELSLARNAIISAFKQHNIDADLGFLAHEEMQDSQDRTHRSIVMRLQRESINRQLVRVLMVNLSHQEADFLRRHYRDGRTIQYLSMQMPFSERQLYAMNERILRRLASFLSYLPSTDDAYFPRVPINLLSIIDERLLIVSLQKIEVNEAWMKGMYRKRSISFQLFQLMQHMQAENDAYGKLIQARFKKPFMTIPALLEYAKLPISEKLAYSYFQRYMGEVTNILDSMMRI